MFLQLAPNQANPVNWIMDRNFTAITVASDAWQQGLIDAVVVSHGGGEIQREIHLNCVNRVNVNGKWRQASGSCS